MKEKRSGNAFKDGQLVCGQSLEFLFARNETGVHAWELDEALDSGRLDTKRCCRLLDQAIRTVLDPGKPLLVPQRLL